MENGKNRPLRDVLDGKSSRRLIPFSSFFYIGAVYSSFLLHLITIQKLF